MDTDIETMVAEIEARLKDLPRHDANTWELFVADVVVGHQRVGSMMADVTKCVGIETREATALAAMPSDVATLCAMWREAVAERDELRQRLQIVQSTDDGNLDAKAQALADLFAGKNVDGCIATEDEIVAVRKTLSLRAKERQTASERIAELTDVLERVRDLDSLNDLLDLMPTIVKAIGPSPALFTPPPPPTQP